MGYIPILFIAATVFSAGIFWQAFKHHQKREFPEDERGSAQERARVALIELGGVVDNAPYVDSIMDRVRCEGVGVEALSVNLGYDEKRDEFYKINR